MSFLNQLLLAGLAAAAIPVIIHLLNRRRYQVVRWGAMHLLNSIVKTHTRRLRLEQWLLLLVRVAIPTLLALCMARPVITAMRHLLGNERTSLVTLLDNSYSMEAGDAVKSSFAAAREETTNILETLPYGSEAAVVGLAGALPPALGDPSFDRAQMQKELVETACGYGLASPGPAFETAAGLFASRLFQQDRVLLIVSDFQRISWAAEGAEARGRALELLRQQPIPPEVLLLPVGKPATDNVAVTSLELSRQVVGVKQRLYVRANLRNYGETPWADLRVYLRVNGKEEGISQTALAPGQSTQVLFAHTFDTPGSQVIEVSADADALRADNVARASLLVLDQIPVLLVSGDTSPGPLGSETAYLELALRPYGTGKSGLADLMTTRVVTPEALQPADLGQARVVVLANVRQLTETQQAALEDYVREGGGLLVFPGNRVDAAWYNAHLVGEGGGLLPYRLAALVGNLENKGRPAAILARHYEHPALQLFNDPRNGNLSAAEVRLHYQLVKPPAPPTGTPVATVMAELDSGSPFLVERAYGEGRVVQCCLPADADWSNLPLRPCYLPLMQELVTALASQLYPPRNIQVGERLAAFVAASEAGRHATIVDPAGARHQVPVVAKGSRGVIEFRDTDQPGLYVLETQGGETIHYVASTSRAESDLTRLSDAELAKLATELGGKVIHSWKDYRDLADLRRHGQELWLAVWWVVLILLFGELALQQFFTRKRVE